MQLSVVILNYQAPGFLELCVDSVVRATRELQAEIIVVDNKSPSQDLGFIEHCKTVRLIQSRENLGFAGGNNLGVSAAKGEYLCILNPDTIVPETIFLEFLHFFENQGIEDRLGFVGPRLIDGSGNFLPECKRHVPTPSIALKKLAGNSSEYYVKEQPEKSDGPVDVLVGAFMFTRREVYMDCGGLDDRYFMYGEDIDICYMALLKGYRNYYLGSQTVIHFKGESTRKDATYRKHFYNAMKLFYDKHFGKSLLMRSIVSISAQILPLLSQRRSKSQQDLIYHSGIVLTDDNDARIFDWLSPKSIQRLSLNETSAIDQLIIFDTATLTSTEIIAYIDEHAGHGKQFRFLSQKRDFILGSDSAEGKGGLIWR